MAKKVLSIALALLMVFNVFAVAVSATEWTTEDAVITLKTDDTKPMPGDEVTVTVALQNNYNVHALQIMVAYDKNYYEVVGTADNAFTNLLVSDGAKFTGVAQSHLAADAQDAMYAGLYSASQKAQYGLVRIGYVWLASLASNAGATATPVFTNTTDLASFKLKVKTDAPQDGKGVIMVDPVFVVEEGVDTPAFDTRSATYVGKGATTISASATQGKLYGLPINVDDAKFAGCVHVAGEAVRENEVSATPTVDGSYDMVVYCTVCGEELSRETVEIPMIDGYFKAAEGSTTVINEELGCIYGLGFCLRDRDLEDYVEYSSSVSYEIPDGIGTGAVLQTYRGGKAWKTYTIVIFGDLNGDGVADIYDSSFLAAIVNGDMEFEDGDVRLIASDLNGDTAVDIYDLAILNAVINGETEITQAPGEYALDVGPITPDIDMSDKEACVEITLSEKEVITGDVITVTVKLTTNYYVTGVQLPILYDKTQFELVGNNGGMSYLTFDENSSFVNGRYDLNGNSGLTNGFKYTSNNEYWNTDASRAKYDYAWITAAFNNYTNKSKPNKLAMPKDEVFVTFQVKALGDIEDTTEAIFISPDWTKTDEVKAGAFTMGYSDTEVNTKPLTYVTTGMTYNVETTTSDSAVHECGNDKVSFVEFIERVEADCYSDGNIAYYICSCGKLYLDENATEEINAADAVIPALGHKYDEVVIAPTCTETGFTIYKCSVCGYKGEYEIVYSSSECPQSSHNYANNTNSTKNFSSPGAIKLILKFSSNTKIESGYDYIYIYNADGSLYGKYTGTSLAGETIELDGDSFSIKLTSDFSVTCYGYSFDSITAITIDDDLREEIPALGHTSGEAVRENEIAEEIGKEGSYDSVVYCITCGKELSRETVYHESATDSELFEYTINNGEVTITGYVGADTDVVIPSRIEGYPVTTIGEYAFSSLGDITSVVIPYSVRAIGNYAFYRCESIESILIVNGVRSIGKYAFAYCVSVASVTIPESVTSIGTNAFAYGFALDSITVDADNAYYSSDEQGVLFNKNKTTLIQYPGGKSGDYIIPESTTTIGEYAFYRCENLSSIVMPEGVETIGLYAFSYCYGLTTVTIPDKVVTINEGAFYGCANLGEITIGRDVATIADKVFSGCNMLTDVYYNGSERSWNKVSIDENNDSLDNATIHFMLKFDFNNLNVLRGTASAEKINGEEVVILTKAEGRTMVGFYKALLDGSTAELEHTHGEIRDMDTYYVAYSSENIVNPSARVKITFSDGTVERYTIIFRILDDTDAIISPYGCDSSSLTRIEGFDAACAKSGRITRYECVCGKIYLDSESENEITSDDVIIPALGHTPGEWVVTKDATVTENGEEVCRCTVCNAIIESREIPKLSYSVSGIVKSSETSGSNTDNEVITIEFISDGEIVYSTTVSGSGEVSYSFSDIGFGAYTIKVSKAYHATFEQEITIESDTEIDFVINLLGDIDGNGKITVTDYSRTLAHVKETSSLDGYELECADIDGNGRVNVVDCVRVLRHIKQITAIW